MTGVIKNVNTEKGFGFIRPDEGGEDFFFHWQDLASRDRSEFAALTRGDRVEFEDTDTAKGPRAVNVIRL